MIERPVKQETGQFHQALLYTETQRLMELLGHTPLEVLVGALLGVGSALLWAKITP